MLLIVVNLKYYKSSIGQWLQISLIMERLRIYDQQRLTCVKIIKSHLSIDPLFREQFSLVNFIQWDLNIQSTDAGTFIHF